jgi:hypothetical protein
MIDVASIIEKELASTPLEILVFGPAVDPPSPDPFVASLQNKRKEIKTRLIADGHSVAFGEDVVNPSIPAAPLVQEIAAMSAADLIIVLVGSPGAIMEATTISHNKSLCGKASFYCFENHKDGLVVKHLQYIIQFGATLQLVTLPDVQICKLTTTVLEKVRAIQIGKAFLF